MKRDLLVRLVGGIFGAALMLLLVLPLAALALGVRASDFTRAVDRGLLEALGTSLVSTTVSALFITLLGTPLAYWLAAREGMLVRLVEALVRLPAVTPPAVAGVALLSAFGRRGLFGSALEALGIALPFTPGAVVIAQIFVASPFYVLPAAAAFRAIDPTLLWTARSLGAGPLRVFARIAVPLAAPALFAGLAVAWARALGEFGATLMFAGNLPGTQTLPVAIYAAMEGDLGPARAMAIVLLAWAVFLFTSLRSLPSMRKCSRP